MGTCTKKRFRRAIDVKIILAFKGERRNEVRYYWCAECGAYHLTSKPKRDKRDGMQAGQLRTMHVGMFLRQNRLHGGSEHGGSKQCQFAGQRRGSTR
jgi:hypothetical protein